MGFGSFSSSRIILSSISAFPWIGWTGFRYGFLSSNSSLFGRFSSMLAFSSYSSCSSALARASTRAPSASSALARASTLSRYILASMRLCSNSAVFFYCLIRLMLLILSSCLNAVTVDLAIMITLTSTPKKMIPIIDQPNAALKPYLPPKKRASSAI